MCSMASLLFLRFGLLSLFDPGPPQKKKKKRGEKRLKLAKLLRKLAPKGKKAKAGGKGQFIEEMAEPEMAEEVKADETWTKERGNGQKIGGKLEDEAGGEIGRGGFVEWTLGAFEEDGEEEDEEEEEDNVKKKMEEDDKDVGMIVTSRKRSISTSNLHNWTGAAAADGGGAIEEIKLTSRAQSTGRELQQLQEQQQKGELQLAVEEGQKKRKKSFKICQCIPKAKNTIEEEIQLPSTISSIPAKLFHPKIMSTNSGSRFKIIPVENRYKRGRWQCWDYYEGGDLLKKGVLLSSMKPKEDVHHHQYSPCSSEKEYVHQFGGRNNAVHSSSLSPPGQCQTPPPPGSQMMQMPPQQLPRRNSFQLIQIKNLEDRRFSSSVPTSISEEKLNSPDLLEKEEVRSENGTPPFVTRRIVQNEQIRVPGNTTKAELAPLPGVQYGLQICAFYTEKEWTEQKQMDEEQNPFHIVPVIPFTCTPCQNRASADGCIDCSKIEESSSSSTQKMSITTPTLLAQTPDPVECIGPICAAANHSSVHFISSDTVVLDVFGAKVSVPMPSTSDSTEMPTTTTKRCWEGNDEVRKEGKKEEENDDDGRRKNEEILPGERPFKQRHSKTHLPDQPIVLNESEEAKSTTTELASTNGDEEMNKTSMMMIGTEESNLGNQMPKCEEEDVKNMKWRMRGDEWKTKEEGKKKEEKEGKKGDEEEKNKTILDERRENNGKNGITETKQPIIKITQRRRDEEEIGGEIYRLTENGKNVSDFAENEMLKMGQMGIQNHQKNQRRLHQPKLMMEEKIDGEEGTKEGGEATISASTMKTETFDTTKRIDVTKSQSSSTISIARTDFIEGGSLQNVNNHEDEESSATFGGIYTMDSQQKLMLAGPIFFLLGLIAGLALFCTAFIRRCRRHRHSPLPSYSASLTPIPRKYLPPPFSGGGYTNKFPARSVLAARTAASSGQQQQCYGQNGGPVGFIGTPIGTISMPTGIPSSQSCPSSNTSTASSATVESRLIGTNGSNSTTKSHHQKRQQNVHPVAHHNPHRPLHPPRPSHPPDQNFFADNTARFFMTSATNSNNGTGSTKNVHF